MSKKQTITINKGCQLSGKSVPGPPSVQPLRLTVASHCALIFVPCLINEAHSNVHQVCAQCSQADSPEFRLLVIFLSFYFYVNIVAREIRAAPSWESVCGAHGMLGRNSSLSSVGRLGKVHCMLFPLGQWFTAFFFFFFK